MRRKLRFSLVSKANGQTWIAPEYEFPTVNRSCIDPRMGWNKVPFDNFYLDETMHPDSWSGRLRFLNPMNAHDVFSTGIPIGYIFRADVSEEAFPKVEGCRVD